MQIILEENEIMDALNAYCANQIKVPEGKRIKVDFTVGRGSNSSTRATIEFEDVNTPTSTVQNETPPVTAEKKIKKAEPEEQVNEIIEEAAKEDSVEKAAEPSVKPMVTKQEKEEPKGTEEPTDSTETSSVKTDSLFNF